MKTNVIRLIKIIANLVAWAFTGINYDKRAKHCAAYERGWCSGQYCGTCSGAVTREEADAMTRHSHNNQNNEEETERKEADAV